jgi:hypothetical protein
VFIYTTYAYTYITIIYVYRYVLYTHSIEESRGLLRVRTYAPISLYQYYALSVNRYSAYPLRTYTV